MSIMSSLLSIFSLMLIVFGVSAELQVTSPELEQRISSHYQKTISQLTQKKNIPDKEKQKILFSEINDFTICILHRKYLYEINPAEQSFLDEKHKLSMHLTAFIKAMERNGLIKSDTLSRQIEKSSPQLLSEIKGVYGRNKNSGSSQATEEVYKLATQCSSRVKRSKNIEYSVNSKLK